jgi:hypothetical protein
MMWPLSLFLLFATAAPYQQDTTPQLHGDRGKPALQMKRTDDGARLRTLLEQQNNLCFTLRTYYFHRQDGQAPVLEGMTTCTPASALSQKQISRRPGMFVPLVLKNGQ